MIHRLIPIVVGLLFATLSFAQTPRNIHITPTTNQSSTHHSPSMMCDAGTISFGTFTGQSTDTDNIVKYLCEGDCLEILHDGNFQIEDPAPSTSSGIGYIFYDCPPSTMGATIADVINDPCTNHTDPIVVFPNDTIFQTSDIWVATDQANGDLKINNNGNIQLAFTENRSDPIQFWFAPVTVHDFPTQGFEDNSGVPGCVDVSTDQAFSIVYLNAVEITNIKAVVGGGEFTARKGLPEFDNGATNYTITITKIDNPSVMGTVTSAPAVDGSTITFTVPEPGCYDILVEDGKSCAAMEQLCTYLEPQFTFSVPSISVPSGSETCVSVQVEGFLDVVSFQFGLIHDDSVITFRDNSEILGVDMPVTSFIAADLPSTMDPNVGTSWIELLGQPTTVPDGTVAFDICFDAIGAEGDCSDLTFGNLASGVQLEVAGIVNPFDASFIIFNHGEICIEDGNLNVDITEIIPQCVNAGSNGGFTLTASQGTPPYSVSWEDFNGDVFGPQMISSSGGSTTISGLLAGDYMITVTDASIPSLAFTGMVTIPVGNLGVNATGTPITCFGGMDGTASVEILVDNVVVVNPDPTDFTFNWERGGDFLGDTPVITNLGAGPPIEVTVTDNASGCEAVGSFTLSQNPAIVLDSVQLTNPECIGFTNGQINVFIGGGVPPYTYTWDSPIGTDNPVLFGVGAGIYTVSVTDSNGCGPLVESFDLADPTAVSLDLTDLQGVSCHNSIFCDGQATAVGAGGSGGPYTFVWSSGEVEMDVLSSSVSALCQGEHSVSVSEGNCGIDSTFIIGAPDSLFLDINGTNSYPTSCFGTVDGSIKVTAGGGTPDYTYNWDIGGSVVQTDSISGLAAGSYSLTIEDANGCTTNIPLIVSEPDPLVVLIDSVMSTPTVACEGDANGVISVFTQGGNVGSMTFDWNPNVSEFSTATGLTSGTYTVTVTDERGCSNLNTYSIGEPDPIIASIVQPDAPLCAGDRTTLTVESASGGVGGPYTFSINNGTPGSIANAVDLLAGEYLVSVFDSLNQCAYEETILIQDPPPVLVDLGEDITIELGQNTQLDGFFFGPNPLDSVVWTPMIICPDSTNNCLDPVVAPTETTEYTLTLIDVNGCFGTDNIIVDVDNDRNVYIPNVFSPDNDGVNDNFTPFIGPGVTNVKSMQVYDRWGTLLFAQDNFLPFNDFEFGWNGTFRGKTVQTGVYVYLIEVEFLDGLTLLYRGDITVLY